ncbi:unnamed protein product [Paramecium sonneborni]|uniref:Uncharacterized protein n=1 Tax=Paramecium sonneborni TaxID=65129 RepID=A0A8S1LVY0_9CILI|nr:unnamed protein product [Paramecium sonneborni]
MIHKNPASDISTLVLKQYKQMYEEICLRFKNEKESQNKEIEIWKDKYDTLQKRWETLNLLKDKSDKKLKQDFYDPKSLNQVHKISGHQLINLQPNLEKQQFQTQIQQLNEQIIKQKKIIQELNDKNEKHSIDNKKLEIENKKYSEQINHIRKTSNHKFNEQQMLQYEDNIQKFILAIDEMKNEKISNEKQIEKLIKENQVLNSSNNELRNTINEYEKSQQQKSLFQLQLSELGLKNAQLEKLVQDLENQQQHQQDLVQQNTKQMEDKQQEIIKLQQKNQEFEKELKNLNQLQVVYDEQQQKLQQLADVIQDLEGKLLQTTKLKLNESEKKQQQQQKYDELYQQYTDLQTQDIMKQEWLNLQKVQLEDLKQENEQLNHQVEELQKQNTILVDQVEQQIDNTRLSFSQLQDQVTSYEQIVTDKNQEIHKLILEISKQKCHLKNEDYEEKIKQLQTQYEKLESESKMKIEWMEIQNTELEETINEYEKKIQNFVEQINQLSLNNQEENSKKIAELQEHIKQYEVIVNNKNIEIDELKKQLNQINQKQNDEDFEKKYLNLKTQFEKLETENQMKQQWQNIQEEEQQEQINQLNIQIDELNDQLSQTQNLNLKLQSELQNEIEKNEQLIKQSQQHLLDIQNQFNSGNIKNALRKSIKKEESQEEEVNTKKKNQDEQFINDLKEKLNTLNEELGEYEENQINLQQQIKELSEQKNKIQSQYEEMYNYYSKAYDQVQNFVVQVDELNKIIQDKENQLVDNQYQIQQLEEQLLQMNDINKDAINENQDINEIKAFYEQKFLEQGTLIQNLQQQLEQSQDQEYYQKMNKVLQENEELRLLRSENQEELNKKDQMIEELQMKMLSQSQVTGSSDLQERKRRQELLNKVKDDKSDNSKSSNEQLVKKIGLQTSGASAKLSLKLDYTQEQSKSSKSKSAKSLDFQE